MVFCPGDRIVQPENGFVIFHLLARVRVRTSRHLDALQTLKLSTPSNAKCGGRAPSNFGHGSQCLHHERCALLARIPIAIVIEAGVFADRSVLHNLDQHLIEPRVAAFCCEVAHGRQAVIAEEQSRYVLL